VVTWPWLVPGPLVVDEIDGLSALIEALSAHGAMVVLDEVTVAGVPCDPFALCAGLSASAPVPLGVLARVDGRRLPTVLGRELIALDHVSEGRCGVVLVGEQPALAECERILSAMCHDGAVEGSASSAMPAPFHFENRPGPTRQGGPPVVVVDQKVGRASHGGAEVGVLEPPDGWWDERAMLAAPSGLVVRQGALGPSPSRWRP